MDDYIQETELSGVFIISRPVFGDERGFFREFFRKSDLEKKLGYKFDVVQGNHSRSTKGVLRGIHVAPWNKLVTIIAGRAQQVVVDLRRDSATFGKHISFEMGDSNRISVFIPSGCGNAYLVLSEEADYSYLTSEYWSPGKEYGVAYNDESLGIKWREENPILSDKDKVNKKLSEINPK